MGRRLKAARRLAIANLKSKIGLGFLLGVEKALVELHAKGQAESLELLLDLVEGLFAEVAVFEHLLLGLHRQLADGGDVGVVQAVRRADGELDLVDRHVEELAELVLLLGVLGGLALELVRLLRDAVEHVEVVLEDGGGLLESVVRRDAAVGPDLEDELVVIGDLADAGVLDRIADEADRGEERVDRDEDRKSTRLNSSHQIISYAVFCLKKKTRDCTVNNGLLTPSADQPPVLETPAASAHPRRDHPGRRRLRRLPRGRTNAMTADSCRYPAR